MKLLSMLLGWLVMFAVDDKGGAPAAGEGEGAPAAGAGEDKGAPADDPAADPNANKDPWGGLREKYAGDDTKKLAKISRYQNPEAALDALISLQDRVRSGELRAPLPKNATPEQVKAWREESGIPETPDKYEISPPKGVEITEADKPYIDKLLSAVHAQNGNTAMANTVVDMFYQVQNDMTQARAIADKEYTTQQEDALRAAWGNEYRMNMNSIQGLLATMPADIKELFERGRLADGNPLLGNAKVAMWLTGLSREINPVTTLVNPANGDVAGALETEIKAIEAQMKAPRTSPEGKKYWDSPETQARYRDLIDARERGKAKAG